MVKDTPSMKVLDSMQTIEEVKGLLRQSLQLGTRADAFTAESRLLGSLPELDSMAVVALLTAIEERFGVTSEDDEVSADVFATVGSLAEFIAGKVGR